MKFAYCLLFIVGQAAYLLKRSIYAIRNPQNPVTSRTDFLRRNWDTILYRSFLDQLLFWSWVLYPDGLTRLLTYAGWNYHIDLPVNVVTCMAAGLFAEVLLDTIALKIKFLQTEIPQVNGVAKAASQGDTK